MISVVIPLYNKAHTITRTLGTVLEQTFKDFEVLIVNDGSTDDGVAVIENYTNDPRVKVINQNNQGVSVARNQGVLNSKYEHIAFLDGDDEWLPGYLMKMNEAILKFPKAGLFCGAGKVRSGGNEHLRLAEKYKAEITEIEFFENPHIFLHTSATIVSKTEFNKTQGFPVGMKRNQDYGLFFALALNTKTIYIGFPLSIYVGDVEGQATSSSFDSIKEHVIRRFNIIHETWCHLNKVNTTYLIFTKYELRCFFIGFLNSKNYKINLFFKNNLNPSLAAEFPNWEWALYTNPKFNKLGILYIYLTKIKWRLNGYPRVTYG